jgi:hypothetical protein
LQKLSLGAILYILFQGRDLVYANLGIIVDFIYCKCCTDKRSVLFYFVRLLVSSSFRNSTTSIAHCYFLVQTPLEKASYNITFWCISLPARFLKTCII